MGPRMATKKQSTKTDSSNTAKLNRADFGGLTDDQVMAYIAQSPIYNATFISKAYASGTYGITDYTHGVTMMQRKVDKVTSGDLSGIEEMLTAQAVALDAIFTECARRACMNLGEYIQASDTYLRLAMKAQGQCRTTLQTLAEIKNPRPVAFVKQANIAHGPQQINNGPDAQPLENMPTGTSACARDFGNPTNKLSGDGNELLANSRASGIARGIDSPLETVGKINRTTDRAG